MQIHPRNSVSRNNSEKSSGRHPRLRNVLNLIFMLGAIVGVAIYLLGNTTVGTIVILAAMSFKIVECSLRLIR